MGKVVTHTSAALHQLHLLLVNLKNGSIRISFSVHANHKAVGQRGYLVIVADARHGASLRHDVLKVIQQTEQLVGT